MSRRPASALVLDNGFQFMAAHPSSAAKSVELVGLIVAQLGARTAAARCEGVTGERLQLHRRGRVLAGCVLANRLNVDPQSRLLIEADGNLWCAHTEGAR